jgi:hypothetical protein
MVDRCTVDDGRAALEVRNRVFREVEDRVDIGVECALPLRPVKIC